MATQTLNMNNLRTTNVKSIKLHTISKLVEYSLKDLWQRQSLFLLFLGYCDPPSRVKGTKGLRLQ